jgi:signal transduction histidine kinase
MAAEEVKSEQRPSDVPNTHRTVAGRDGHYDAMDKLLIVSCEIPSNATIEQAAQALVSAVAGFLDDAALGASIPDGKGGRVIVRSSTRSDLLEQDGTRMFPGLAYEGAISIGLDEGSTLHFAADEKDRFSAAPVQALLTQLALALGAAVRHHRAYTRAEKLSKDVDNLKAQIIQADKLASIGQMVAGIMHELNNPLTSIVAISDFLRKKAKERGADAIDIERLGRITEAAERILDFSRSLTDFSRPAKDSFGPVPIHDVIDRALVFCAHEIEQSDIEVQREYAAYATVHGIVGKLTQVFVNLVTNAAHAMRRKGGKLVVKTELTPSGDWVTIAVHDEGHGIAADHLPHLFDPFFTTKTDGTGTGLGLSIVRNIVLEHRGRIRAEQRSPKGAVFYVELPTTAQAGSLS